MKEFCWGPFCRSIMFKVGRLWGECFQSSCPILPEGGARRHAHTHTLKHARERKEKSSARRMKSEDVITGLPAHDDKPSAAALGKKKSSRTPPPSTSLFLFLPLSLLLPVSFSSLSLSMSPPSHVSRQKYKHASVPACRLPSSTRPRFPHDAVMLAAKSTVAPPIKPFQLDCESQTPGTVGQLSTANYLHAYEQRLFLSLASRKHFTVCKQRLLSCPSTVSQRGSFRRGNSGV